MSGVIKKQQPISISSGWDSTQKPRPICKCFKMISLFLLVLIDFALTDNIISSNDIQQMINLSHLSQVN